MERISLRGICRAVGVTLKWLLGFLVQCFEALPDHLHVQPVSNTSDVLIQRLEVEADELASFVQKKAHKQWVWIAMDAKTCQIIAFHVGDRSHKSAEQLWGFCRKSCSGGHEEAVAPVCGGIRQPGRRTVRPQEGPPFPL